MIFSEAIFFTCGFLIFWAMIGYPVSLKILNVIYKSRKIEKDFNHQPTVTVMVVAHNEEKVILNKLKNIIELDYPKEKIEFLISSDNSTDRTNQIVKEFIDENPGINIRLYEVKNIWEKLMLRMKRKDCYNRISCYDRCKFNDGWKCSKRIDGSFYF